MQSCPGSITVLVMQTDMEFQEDVAELIAVDIVGIKPFLTDWVDLSNLVSVYIQRYLKLVIDTAALDLRGGPKVIKNLSFNGNLYHTSMPSINNHPFYRDYNTKFTDLHMSLRDIRFVKNKKK